MHIETERSRGLSAMTLPDRRSLGILATASAALALTLAAPAAAAPVAPTNLQAVLVGGVQLTWQDNSSDESLFSIESCWGSGCTSFRQIATVGANSTSYVDPTSDAGVNRYRVAAVQADGSAAYSAIAEVSYFGAEEPSASFTANPTEGTAPLPVTFDGTASAAFGGGLVNSWTWTLGDGTTATGAVVSHTYQQPGSYTVVLTVRTALGVDATSTVVSVRPGLVAPQSLLATATARGRVDLSWTNPVSSTTSIAVQRCAGVGCSTFGTIAAVNAGTASFSDTTVKRRKSYTYRLVATDGAASVASDTATVVSR
jgi:PKD repeat protein